MRTLSLLLSALLLAGAPAHAEDRRARVSVSETRLDRAILVVGRQTGASIGLRDRSLATLRVREVSGRMTAGEALDRMLRGTGARAREIAPGTYLVERAPPEPLRAAPEQRAARIAEPEPPLPDIIVTASKRDTPLFAYAGAVTIVDGGRLSLAEAGRGTGAIEARVASLTSTHLGPGRNKLFIRGIADSSFTGPTQATVGQYWGHSRVTYSAPDPNLRLYDVASVEVLEGPQGTLYGAGALGGIIRVVPEAPHLGVFESHGWGGVQATEHGAPGGDLGGLVNVPLADDRLALRALAYGAIDGGYIDDRLREKDDVNRVETAGARGTLRFAPGGNWTIDLSGTFQSIAGRDAQYADRLGEKLSRESAVAQPFRNDYLLGELAVRGRWGATELVAAIGVVDQYVSERFDATSGFEPRAFTQESRVRMITSEARIARREADGSGWVIGASFLGNETRIDRELDRLMLVTPAAGVTNRVDEATLYGEATMAVTSWLALTGGGRLTHSRLSGSAEDVPLVSPYRYDPAARASRSETRLLPSAAVWLRPADRLALFARYQEGYRPGGLALGTDYVQRFQGDHIATVELGLRYGGGRGDALDLALTAAATRWSDIQADLIDGTGFPITANIGDGRIHSLGMSVTWRPLPGLTLDGALHLNDSKVTAPAPALIGLYAAADARGDVETEPLPNVADASARLGFDYWTPVSDRFDLRFRGHLRYIGESRLGLGPDLDKPQGDYVDTALEARLIDDRHAVSLSITNLFDARGNRFALGSPFLVRDGDHITPLRPRTIRLGFSTAF